MSDTQPQHRNVVLNRFLIGRFLMIPFLLILSGLMASEFTASPAPAEILPAFFLETPPENTSLDSAVDMRSIHEEDFWLPSPIPQQAVFQPVPAATAAKSPIEPAAMLSKRAGHSKERKQSHAKQIHTATSHQNTSPLVVSHVVVSKPVVSHSETHSITHSENRSSIMPLAAKSITVAATTPVKHGDSHPAAPKAKSKIAPHLNSDPEAQPLALYEKEHTAITQKSNSLLTQLAINLAGVLILFAGFARWALPHLMQRYPDFFERMRRQYENTQQTKTASTTDPSVTNNKPRTFNRFIPPPKKTARVSQTGKVAVSALHQLKNWMTPPHPLQQGQPGKDKPLMDSASLCVLTSTSLGDGRELHLVDIPTLDASRRRLLLASTPEGISVLQDLSEQPQRIFSKIESDLNSIAAASRPASPSASSVWSAPSGNRPGGIQAMNLQNANEEVTILNDYDDTY